MRVVNLAEQAAGFLARYSDLKRASVRSVGGRCDLLPVIQVVFGEGDDWEVGIVQVADLIPDSVRDMQAERDRRALFIGYMSDAVSRSTVAAPKIGEALTVVAVEAATGALSIKFVSYEYRGADVVFGEPQDARGAHGRVPDLLLAAVQA